MMYFEHLIHMLINIGLRRLFVIPNKTHLEDSFVVVSSLGWTDWCDGRAVYNRHILHTWWRCSADCCLANCWCLQSEHILLLVASLETHGSCLGYILRLLRRFTMIIYAVVETCIRKFRFPLGCWHFLELWIPWHHVFSNELASYHFLSAWSKVNLVRAQYLCFAYYLIAWRV